MFPFGRHPFGFSGAIAYVVGRKLAMTRTRSLAQIQRLASLTNIGKTISLRFTTDQLLMAVYTECRKIVDCSLFTIALLDSWAMVGDVLCAEGELLAAIQDRDDI